MTKYDNDYYHKNKIQILARQKIYYQQNRENIIARNKQYLSDNPIKRKAYDENKKKHNTPERRKKRSEQKYKCEACNKELTCHHKARHEATIKHQKNIKLLEINK